MLKNKYIAYLNSTLADTDHEIRNAILARRFARKVELMDWRNNLQAYIGRVNKMTSVEFIQQHISVMPEIIATLGL